VLAERLTAHSDRHLAGDAATDGDAAGWQRCGPERALWREERGTPSCCSALADHDPVKLRRAALQAADELSNREAGALLIDAATDAVIESRRLGD
jgi:hypothetical protein